MKDFKIGQLTKVLVAERLRKMDDLCGAASEIVKQVLLVALKSATPADPTWKKIAQDACQGGITAILLSELDVAQGAMKILTATSEAAYELNLDAEEMRDAALRGIVDVRRFLSADKLLALQAELTKRSPKAGKDFAGMLYSNIFDEMHT